ncbi:hypothetical protein VQL36_16135 [Chengkuizengella sp. SCS-71B]
MGFVYAANVFADTVSVIASSTNSVIATVPVGNEPVAIVITPN